MKVDIDRTIEKLKLVVEKMKVVGDSNYWTMEEHEQLADWLEELKRRREHDGEIIGSGALNNAYNQGYNKAIDSFEKEICKMIVQSENNGNYRFYAVEIKQAIADLAEQLKEGGTDE